MPNEIAAADDEDEGEARPGVAAEAPTVPALPTPPTPTPTPPMPPFSPGMLLRGRRLLTAGGRWDEPTELPTLLLLLPLPLLLMSAAEESAFSHTVNQGKTGFFN